MIQAEKAERIMQLYERDYDNFLKGLRKKSKGKSVKEKVKVEQTLKEAKDHKGTHLAQKAKDLLDKNGGMEGAKHTVDNVMKYFKDNTPSDYSVSVGGSGTEQKGNSDSTKDEKADGKIMGLPPIAVYAGGGLLVLAAIWGLSVIVKKHQDKVIAEQSNLTQQRA